MSNQNCVKLSRLEFFFLLLLCIVRAYIESHFQCSFKTSLELSTVVCMYGPLYLAYAYSKTSSLGYTLSSDIIFVFLSQNSCLTFVSLCNVIINMITQIVQIWLDYIFFWVCYMGVNLTLSVYQVDLRLSDYEELQLQLDLSF